MFCDVCLLRRVGAHHPRPYPTLTFSGRQVRRRDAESRKVVVEECRYDTADEAEPADFAASSSLRTASSAPEVLETLVEPPEPEPLFIAAPDFSGPLQPATFGHSFGSDDDPQAWAKRLRSIPDKVR